MKLAFRFSLLILLSAAIIGAATDHPSRPLARKGALVFSDDFARTGLGDAWQTVIPTFTVVDGVLKGTQTRATIDNQPVAYLKSSGLAHPKKDDLRINVWGKDGDGLVDDLRVWAVEVVDVR